MTTVCQAVAIGTWGLATLALTPPCEVQWETCGLHLASEGGARQSMPSAPVAVGSLQSLGPGFVAAGWRGWHPECNVSGDTFRELVAGGKSLLIRGLSSIPAPRWSFRDQ